MEQKGSYFQVSLNGLELDEKQTLELEAQIRKATIKFLGGFEKGSKYLDDLVGYTPHPDDPDPFPWPPRIPIPEPLPWPIPRPYPGFFPIRRSWLDRNFIDVRKMK